MINTESKVLLRNEADQSREIWLNLPFGEDDLNEALQSIGINPDDDEGADPFDQLVRGEELPCGYYVADISSKYLKPDHLQNIFAASDLVERIEGLDSGQEDLLDALLEDGDDLETAVEECENGDIVFYPDTNLADLAEQFGEEEMFSKEFLLQHVDWEAVGRELSFNGYTEVAGGVLCRN